MNDDAALLRDYVEQKSEAAFADLVKRHVDLVYGAALRRTGGDSHRAADVAQEVFTALARHARSLSSHTVLPAWLHTATRNAALKLMISEQRRRAREAQALALDTADGDSVAWDRMRPLLDAAIDELPETDRAAVVLRFLERRSFADIGAALRVSEDAARMRTDRALDKLRAALARRGISSSAAALGAVVTGQAVVAAPAGLAASLATQSLAAAGTGFSFVTAFTSSTMTKTLTTLGIGILLTFVTFSYARRDRAAPSPGASSPGSPAQTPAIAALRPNNESPGSTGKTSPTVDATALPAGADVGALLAPLLAKHKIPGMAAVVLRGGQIVAQGVAGVRQAGGAERVTLDDRFHLGSDSKAMTATLAGLFVDEGKLQWTTTLGEVFGGAVPEMNPAWKQVTLQQLLAHRAGLPADIPMGLRARLVASTLPLRRQRFEFVQEMLSSAPAAAPGAKFVYSNSGFILVGAMLEQISGRDWEDLMRERLFAPLDIVTGGFGPPGKNGNTNQPWGHGADGRPIRPDGLGADNPAFYGPAGAVHMTLPDWSKFVALHLRGDRANPQTEARLLRPETFAHLHTPATGENYIGGWVTSTRPWAKGPRHSDTGQVLWHTGSNTMWYCVTFLAPEVDYALLVACNQGGSEATKACDEAATALLKKIAPENNSPAPAR